jgi:arsenate reductase-like glutaredoxin family protein
MIMILSEQHYSREELDAKLREFNIELREFSNKDLTVLERKSKEEVEQFFVEYEAERLSIFSEMLKRLKLANDGGGEDA